MGVEEDRKLDTSPMAELAGALLALFAHMERVFARERPAARRAGLVTGDRQAARLLAAQAHTVSRASGREPWRDVLRWLSRGRYGQRVQHESVSPGAK